MVAAVSGATPVVHRGAPNLWWLVVGAAPTSMAEVLAQLTPTSLPSEALQLLDSEVTAVVAKLELDVCGAWLTVANATAPRPVVVRRAGWVDLRGHPAGPVGAGVEPAPADDRVGLGPADVLVLRLAADASAGDALDDDVVDACLGCAGCPPDEIADGVHARVGGQVVAVGVPAELGADPLVRVATATGIAAHEVQSPGYPLGDLQPDLWKRPPRPPRLARVRLSPDRRSVASVRSLLDRLLASWRLDGRLDPGDVKLVATELASNAVVHGGEPETVTVRFTGDAVRIEVTDRSSTVPTPRAAPPDATGGRGLQLIEALGSAWGTEQYEVGKRVWCELAVASG
jgi:anti-sigma regulatory factor (Ser/Thr protein kinase)